MKKHDEREWVAVAATGDDEKAELIAGFLRSQGIESVVEGPSMTPFPEDLGTFGESRVMVPPDRAEEARASIAAREREPAGGERDGSSDEEE